ncbi:MAG: NAD(+)/NADH kinase [Clostridiales bacterium]|nr:NAD(+)/NADH kinase [Clostridiales bacterium]
MKSVYMLMHQRKPDANRLAGRVLQALQHAHIAVAAEPWIQERLDGSVRSSLAALPPERCEAVLSVGGDGTLLRANALAVRYNLPLLGINVGRVGFLTEVELDRLEEACIRLANDEYSLETRMMLKASMGDHTDYALNDVVLSRGGYSRLIGVNAWVDGDRVGPFIADGLIVSTPTGSTGYSLSAGGPLVCPEVECMVLTPICAHSLQHRPVVTSAAQTITVRLDGGYNAMISVDGRKPWSFSGDQTLTITRAEHAARFIRLEPKSFFSTIRIKLSEWTR